MSSKTLIIILMLFRNVLPVLAGGGTYAVNAIPASLLVNANAVKRYEEIRFEVVTLEKARYYHKVAYTILNENGDRFAHCLETYDVLQSVVSIEGRLFDETGKKIKSLKQSDVQDRSGTNDISLADDNRIRYHNFYHRTYPYTVEYETELRMNHTMYYPGWVPLDDENLSLEYGKMTVVLPAAIDFRYKLFNIKGPVVTDDRSAKLYTWELRDVAALKNEYASPHSYEINPVVCMAPVQFSVQGYQGNMSSWLDFGKFVYALKEGRDRLPENTKQAVHSMTDGISNPYEKISVLYDFLQKNTRYISIQLGLGGWQPFNAQYVANNRYGDCKALTNYMYSLLKEAGIRSNYTLVGAGQGRTFFMNDFPSLQFNHVILSIPVQKDTVWLECTNQSISPGYLSGFTSNRPVLVIDESGGYLVRTPKYSMDDNLQVRKITAALTDEGDLNATVNTMYKGMQEDDVQALINGLSKEKIMEHLKEQIDLPSYDISDYQYTEQKSKLPYIDETLKIKAGNYAQFTGKRIFLEPNIMSKNNRKLLPDTNRMCDIDLYFEYRDLDTAEISIPAGYQLESVPQDVMIESTFGKYNAQIKFTGDKLTYTRSMEQRSGRYLAKDYAEMVQFYNKIYVADRKKIVFVKK